MVDGTDATIAADLAGFSVSQAGPKFSHGKDAGNQDEDYLVYTERVAAGEYRVAIRKMNPRAQACSDRSDAGACFPADDEHQGRISLEEPYPGDKEERRIAYTTEEESPHLSYRAQAIYHFNVDGVGSNLSWAPLHNYLIDPGIGTGEVSFPEDSGTIWGRLQEKKMPNNTYALKAATTYVSGMPAQRHVHLIDWSTQAVEDVTGTRTGMKFNPYLFIHSLANKNMVAYRRMPNASQSDIDVYVEDTVGSGVWTRLTTIDIDTLLDDDPTADPDEVFLLSPEAFYYTVGGTTYTYLLFYAANDDEIPLSDHGSIWIARLSPNGDVAAKRINDNTASLVRIEPEVYFSSPTARPVFYYNQLTDPECATVTECQGGGQICLENFTLHRVVLSSDTDMP